MMKLSWAYFACAALSVSAAVTCPNYTHKDDLAIGAPAQYLPEGFAVYGLGRKTDDPLISIDAYGLFRTSLTQYAPVIVPGSETHVPASVDISEDGRWFLYTFSGHVYLLPEAGGTAVQADTNTTVMSNYNYPALFSGFYRLSPKGSEIWYNAGDGLILARQVDLSTSVPVWGSVRTILDFTAYTWRFYLQRDIQMAVVGSHILAGAFSPLSPVGHRTFQFTIPDNGNGTATEADAYQFLATYTLPTPEAGESGLYNGVYGCGHALSPDGTKAISNSGGTGNECVPSKWTSPDTDHKGFMMSKFLESSAPAINLHDIILNPDYGISINWVPAEYRKGVWNAWDFNNWNFSNDERYVIGAQNGYESDTHALWVIDWSHSIWYPITPRDTLHGSPTDPAMFVGKAGTIYSSASSSAGNYDPILDPANPMYKVLAPKTGDVLPVLKPCSLHITAVRPGSATVLLVRGRQTVILPELNHSFNPINDSIVTFTIPQLAVDGTGADVVMNGSGWKVYVQDYGNKTFVGISGEFSIYDPDPPTALQAQAFALHRAAFQTGVIHNGSLQVWIPEGVTHMSILDVQGNVLWTGAVSPGAARLQKMALSVPAQPVLVKF